MNQYQTQTNAYTYAYPKNVFNSAISKSVDSFIYERLMRDEGQRSSGPGFKRDLESLSTASLEKLLDDVMTDRTFLHRIKVIQNLGDILERIKATMKHNANAQFIPPAEAQKIIQDMMGNGWYHHQDHQGAVSQPTRKRTKVRRKQDEYFHENHTSLPNTPSSFTHWSEQPKSSKFKVQTSSKTHVLENDNFNYTSSSSVTGAKGINILKECNRALDELLSRHQSSSLRLAIPRQLPLPWKSKQLFHPPQFPPVTYRDNRSFRLRSEYLERQIRKSNSNTAAAASRIFTPTNSSRTISTRHTETERTSTTNLEIDNHTQDTATDPKSTTDLLELKQEKTELVTTTPDDNDNDLEVTISVSTPAPKGINKDNLSLDSSTITTSGPSGTEIPFVVKVSAKQAHPQVQPQQPKNERETRESGTVIDEAITVEERNFVESNLTSSPCSTYELGNTTLTLTDDQRQDVQSGVPAVLDYDLLTNPENNEIRHLVEEIMKFKLHAQAEEQTSSSVASSCASSVLCGTQNKSHCSLVTEVTKNTDQSTISSLHSPISELNDNQDASHFGCNINGNAPGDAGFQEIIHRKLLLACAGLSPSPTVSIEDEFSTSSDADTDTNTSYNSFSNNQFYSQQYFSAQEFVDSDKTSGSEFMDVSSSDNFHRLRNHSLPLLKDSPSTPPPGVIPSTLHSRNSSSNNNGRSPSKNFPQTDEIAPDPKNDTEDSLASSVKETLHMAADKLVDDIMTTLVSEFAGLLLPGGH